MKRYLGIDIGGTGIKLGICDSEGHILHKSTVATMADRLTQEEIAAHLCDAAEMIVQESGLSFADISSIGIGSPGIVDNKRGLLIFAGNLPFRNLRLRDYVVRRFGLPVYMANDANAAALAESRIGAGVGTDSSITITLGTGVGGGVVINRRVFSGFNGAAAELGHMVIVADGEPCTCGRVGCLEAYSAATALIREAKRAAEREPNSALAAELKAAGDFGAKLVIDLSRAGDPLAKAIVDRYMQYLAEGLANLINAFMPELIIIGGGVSHAGEWFVKEIEKKTREICFFTDDLPMTQFALAGLGNDAGIVGAAFFAQDCQDDGFDGLGR